MEGSITNNLVDENDFSVRQTHNETTWYDKVGDSIIFSTVRSSANVAIEDEACDVTVEVVQNICTYGKLHN